MKILVVGSGGREHAVIKKLKESPLCKEIYCCPGNAGIAKDAELINISATDINGVLNFSYENKMDLVVVTPDDPLVLGMVDVLEAHGIKTFGPTQAAAIIEGSKVFAKDLMQKYAIPTAAYGSFEDVDTAMIFVKSLGSYPVVIKADGLALGKGVVIAESETEAEETLKSMLLGGRFGKSGNKVVVEEFLKGTEISLLCLTDGETVFSLASSMDHKAAFDNDKGPNTGGMGTIAPHPLYTEEVRKVVEQNILYPTINAMKSENRTFKGCLYCGLMLTEKGPYVIEYNCRFGDPEAQVVLPLLEGDLVEIMLAIHSGTLEDCNLSVKSGGAACVILASGGYPANYEKGFVIEGLDANGQSEDVTVYHAGTAIKDDKFITNGGRVLGITATADNISEALKICYNKTSEIKFENGFFRKDIGRGLSK